MLTTGMSMFGKMSVGVRTIERPPNREIKIAGTIIVYGCFSASLTIHIMIHLPLIVPPGQPEPHRKISSRPVLRGPGIQGGDQLLGCLAAGGGGTVPDRTMRLAGISLPYTRLLSPLSGRMVEPSRETPA